MKYTALIFAGLIHCATCDNGLRYTGDVNGDCVVDSLDYLRVLACYGQDPYECGDADINLRWMMWDMDAREWVHTDTDDVLNFRIVQGDGAIDSMDLLAVLEDWGKTTN